MEWVLGIGIGLFLLFAFPRKMLALLALAALIVGAGLLYLYVAGSIQSSRAERDRQAVSITAAYDRQLCTTDTHPIIVKIVNHDPKRTVEYVSYTMQGFRPGYSSPVTESLYRTSDRIIAPGGGWGVCWAARNYDFQEIPSDLSLIEWRVVPSVIRFQAQ